MTAEHPGVLVDAFAPPATLADAMRVADEYAREGYAVHFERSSLTDRVLLVREVPGCPK